MILNKVIEFCNQERENFKQSYLTERWTRLSFDEKNKLLTYFKYHLLEMEKTITSQEVVKFERLQMWILGKFDVEISDIPVSLFRKIVIENNRQEKYGVPDLFSFQLGEK